MFVEISRLLIVVLCMLTGLALGRSADSSAAMTTTLVLGTLVGYVGGGIIGRLLERALGLAERRAAAVSGPTLVAATTGALAGAMAGGLLTLPLFVLAAPRTAVPLGMLVIWTSLTLGVRVAMHKRDELFAMAGLSTRPLVRSEPYEPADGHIVDTSAVMDGQLPGLARAGLLDRDLLVPRFVLDELQGFADAREGAQARRARRGLEALEALRREGPVRVRVLDDEVPEHHEVDAKLVALARRLQIRLLTCDVNLQRVAEVQGVQVLNLRTLAADLRPEHVAGEVVAVELVRRGKEPGQAVGYLDDGSMVVVNGASERVGDTVDVEIATTLHTSVGILLFAHLAALPSGLEATQPGRA